MKSRKIGREEGEEEKRRGLEKGEEERRRGLALSPYSLHRPQPR
jgi:hypothetical protein